MMDQHIQQPWDIEADRYQKEHDDATLDTCRDLVIIHWLAEAGDARPYVDWVLRYDHRPAREVNKLLALMLHPEPNPRVPIPFRFLKKKRCGGKGRVPDLAAAERDRLLAENVTKIMKDLGKGSYESAIAQLAELDGLTARAVRKAYDKSKKS